MMCAKACILNDIEKYKEAEKLLVEAQALAAEMFEPIHSQNAACNYWLSLLYYA